MISPSRVSVDVAASPREIRIAAAVTLVPLMVGPLGIVVALMPAATVVSPLIEPIGVPSVAMVSEVVAVMVIDKQTRHDQRCVQYVTRSIVVTDVQMNATAPVDGRV